MSLISAGSIQHGRSSTNEEVFTSSAPNNGTLVLKRGGPALPLSTVLTVEADDSVTFGAGVSGPLLGTGGTAISVMGSRLANTNYTNTSGTFKAVYVTTNYGSTVSTLLVDGVAVNYTIGNGSNPLSTAVGIVPPNSVYRFNCAGAILAWAEHDL